MMNLVRKKLQPKSLLYRLIGGRRRSQKEEDMLVIVGDVLIRRG